ncbi:hypothetical protein [Streptomyces sp. TS71-3]|uniref:hypothetical protein n=1 Tax=Streptomyces sp. TS71-3 TaxID=2733862 RepID=UPI001B1FB73C|nr:hypothetical protein [Streptomyces sp. TS71-3]GHJ35811.1 hypothetical protein Sm713_14200 [Streptomyces sp. TS71-3]
MLLEALASGLLGLALAWAAAQRLPHRLPSRHLVLSTGTAGGLFGAFVTHSALGSGHVVVTLIGAIAVASASLSLLLRTGRLRPSASA